MISGNISDKDMQQLKYVQKYWRDTYSNCIRLVSISEANVSVAKKKIRESVLNDGFDTFVYDTFKIQEKDFANARQDLALVRDSRDFDKLCKKYNLIQQDTQNATRLELKNRISKILEDEQTKFDKEICE